VAAVEASFVALVVAAGASSLARSSGGRGFSAELGRRASGAARGFDAKQRGRATAETAESGLPPETPGMRAGERI
jgi:hypothetical protein